MISCSNPFLVTSLAFDIFQLDIKSKDSFSAKYVFISKCNILEMYVMLIIINDNLLSTYYVQSSLLVLT